MIEDTEPAEPTGEQDLPLDENVLDDDEQAMARCPRCNELIHEETVKCPHCGEWIIDRPADMARRSKWFWPIVVAIGIAMILVTLVARSL